MKDKLCDGCALYRCPGPVLGEFTDDQVDIVFIGEALGAVEVQQKRPMVGVAGRTLRSVLKVLDLNSFGITNVWKCRPPGNKLPEDEEPGELCKQSLLEDLTTHGQKLTVPLGGTALNALSQNDLGMLATNRRLFTVMFDGRPLPVLPLTHPSYVNRRGGEWRDWELGFDKLLMYLRGVTDYISPDARTVHQVTTLPLAFEWLYWLIETKDTHKVMSCDIETSAGYSPWAGARILCISIAWSYTESIAITWDVFDSSSTAYDLLKALLEDPEIEWLWYNGPFDTQHLRYAGIVPRIARDAMLEASSLDERANVHSLKRDSGVFLDAPDWEHDVKEYAPKKTDSYELIPLPKLLHYNGLDTVHTQHLSSVLRRHLEEEEVLDYHNRVVIPTFDMLAEARFVGMRVDMYRVKELQERIQPVLDDLILQTTKLTGNPFFNPNSYKDKLKALHDRGIKVPDTRKDTLEIYTGDELVDLIREYMDAHKILTTYILGIADDVYDDLRVHPDWKTPAETGRPRCQDPNMLGMPRKAEIEEHRWKRYVKDIFVADPGTLLMEIDRRQSEVRCEVFLADDVDFIEHLKTNPDSDIHAEYTILVYGPHFTKEQRVLIKMVVFGLLYNRKAASLAKQFTAIERHKAKLEERSTYKEWSVRDAQKFIDDFFGHIPAVVRHRKEVIKEALTTWRLTSYFGRVRRFGLVNQDNRISVENQAVNFPPSSLSADINFLSCIETRKQFGKYGVQVMVPIHDSGLLRIPSDSHDLPDEIKGMWEGLTSKLLHTDLPFPCDVSVGERWSDL